MTVRSRIVAALIAGIAIGAMLTAIVAGISDHEKRSEDAFPAVNVLVGNIENDLSSMVTGADRYLRSGKKVDLAPYTRGTAALPKDMAALALRGDETGTSVKRQVTALDEAAQDESQVVESMVASTEGGDPTFGAKFVRGLDEQLPRVRVSFEQAKLALEGGSP